MNFRKFMGDFSTPHPPSHRADDAEIKALQVGRDYQDRMNKMALEMKIMRKYREENGGATTPAE